MRDPPSTPTQLSITWAITPEESSATNASSGTNCSDARMRSTNDATSSGCHESGADHVCDRGVVGVALGTDEDALGRVERW